MAALRERLGLDAGPELDRAALALLEAHRLIEPVEPAQVRVLPAIARFAKPTAAHVRSMSVTVLHPPPPAQTARYRLQRAGLIGLYEYENETFEFERGRLLLRGPNGSGKSKALELLLPLLLDGELRAERLDPFGGRGRSMRWNLVGDHGARAPASGFSWLELHRRDEHDVEHWVTLVLMTRANKGETGVHSWFAHARRPHADADGELRGPRIGINASLTEGRHPISRTAFAELAGELIESASVYRERVNALLFGVAQDRYEAIVQLLLSLRKPQLSQTLDPQELSARLTEALPELDRDAVLRVSSRLDQLDRLRAEAAELREVRAAVAAFARTYRDWARAALRERGNLLLEAADAPHAARRGAGGARRRRSARAAERRAALSRAPHRARPAARGGARRPSASCGRPRTGAPPSGSRSFTAWPPRRSGPRRRRKPTSTEPNAKPRELRAPPSAPAPRSISSGRWSRSCSNAAPRPRRSRVSRITRLQSRG